MKRISNPEHPSQETQQTYIRRLQTHSSAAFKQHTAALYAINTQPVAAVCMQQPINAAALPSPLPAYRGEANSGKSSMHSVSLITSVQLLGMLCHANT